MLSHSFRDNVFLPLRVPQLSAVYAPNAQLHFSDIHRAYLLIHKFVLNRPLVIPIQLAFRNVRSRAVIAGRLRLRLLREKGEHGNYSAQHGNFHSHSW
jgi:hypothetical protein